MSHITGTVQSVLPTFKVGPDFGPATHPPDTWVYDFSHTLAPGGTKLLILHFQNVSLPASNRLEVDLGYDTDVFTAADGTDFWTRPININAFAGNLVRIRYITNGAATGGAQIDKYGRGESHAGETGHPSISNCDPFLPGPTYIEPTPTGVFHYDPYWYCVEPPNWENVACVNAPGDVRTRIARSVGMIISVEGSNVSTCSVTLVDTDKVITAGHCHTPEEALTSSITFDYQVNCDGSKPAGYNPRFYKVKAVLNHRYEPTGEGYDYSLLQLAEPPAGITPIQLRPDIPAAGEPVFGVHHPNGAVKKLSVKHPGFDTILASNSLAINVHKNFHVSGGSSGSGLFDTAGRIVGVLSNGDPCGNTGSPSPLKYFPTAAILKDIAPAPPPPVTRDVMLVFDRSGSMSENDGTGRTKIEAARDAVSLFVQLVRTGGNRVGLVSFSTTASRPADFDIAPVNSTNKTTLIGPPPYSGGKVGALAPGGATSIGDGLDQARSQFPSPGANPRAILLLTDGLQNTPPMVDKVEGSLAGIDVHAIGFGTEASLDGALLTALTSAHHGLYTRAEGSLALEKFFSHAFGNIFEAGILLDPEYDLPADQRVGSAQTFQVCGEESITVVIGWDRTDASLLLEVKTPGGTTITDGSAGVEASTGRTWTFLRIPLPFGSERDGTWSVTVLRPGGGGEFPPPTPRLRYFINVIPSGGPRFLRAVENRRYYTGDIINPLVLLRYSNGGWPTNATVQVTITRPNAGAGNILTQSRLRAPISLDGDTLPARQSTLIALEREAGQPLVSFTEQTFDLSDDSENTNGSFEAAAFFGKPLKDLLTMEGNYTFHFRATYGQGCTATRELLWSLHVDVGIDPGRTVINTTIGSTRPDGSRDVTIVVTPRDKYGNNLGPGRSDGVSVTGAVGTTVTGPVQDNGDGSYTIPGTWNPNSGHPPGVVIDQPDRPCVVVQEPPPASTQNCTKWKVLFWLALLVALILLILLLHSL